MAFGFPAKLVQTQTCTAAGNSCGISITATQNNTILVVDCAQRASAAALTLGVSDTLSNSYSTAWAEIDNGVSTMGSQGFYTTNNSGSANTITCTRVGATNQRIFCIAAEIRGIFTGTTPLDGGTRQINTGTNWNSAAFVMNVPDYLAGVACSFNDTSPTWTAGTGFVAQVNPNGNDINVLYEDAVSSGIFTTSASATPSGSLTGPMGIAGFRERINGVMRNSY